ncbi:TonB-dependent receptor [Gammaproteobacteria bacterium]|nr:TonB-dependent receptor [Gammaproteobacteria bacterium]MDB0023647.1 TonB-dependent receptor [Gammaproteobacteria bacterium]MDB0065913.1 TonB-dependent receptor [Gammaproteobacteria bacterium]
MLKKLLFIFPLVISTNVFSQDEAVDSDVEEVVTVGSQIKGAKISGALPVSILTADDIDALGVEDGTELLENLAEQGLNYFTEAESDSGGVNSARGDVGAYNIRNMGVGNTLTLLNGRRLVTNAGYQTELLGGDYVPTMSVNSNLIPTMGLDRVELLKDGASAIYGADAVAGVVNNVIASDYVGFDISYRQQSYDHFAAEDDRLAIKYGVDLNDGATNVSVMFDYYDRDAIKASEDSRWGDSDHRKLIPADSLWANDSSFNNRYSGKWAQIDMRGRTSYSDSAGEIQIIPIGDPRCARSDSKDTGYGTCLAVDTTALADGEYYINPGQIRDYRGSLQRDNLFVFVNHEMSNGKELFAEIGRYTSDYSRLKEPAGDFSVALLQLGPDYYYSDAIGLTDDNSSSNKAIRIDNWRPDIGPRVINVEKETYRYLLGIRGTTDSGWDWESAYLYSEAETNDVTDNRLSNSLLQAGLNDSTSNAINIFSSDVKTALSPAIVSVYRNDVSTLSSIDFKASHPEIMTLPAGPVGMLVGVEYRKETYDEDRDPRLDGTIQYTSAVTGYGPPFVSDVLGSSPTVDTYGTRSTLSMFAEMLIPISEKINAQAAVRHENPNDTDESTVGKFAVGWDVSDDLLIRGSASTSFRVPNLIQQNQRFVPRQGSNTDAVGKYVGANQPLDDSYSMQSFRLLNPNLKPETSTNTSIGFVYSPSVVDGFTMTYDSWEIEKEDTIVLLGRNNRLVEDLVLRLEHGPNNCSAFSNPNVLRDQDAGYTDEEVALFSAKGICPAGEAQIVYDPYANAATRKIAGQDIGLYYDIDTDFGRFKLSANYSKTDEFTQEPTAGYTKLKEAQDSGTFPLSIALSGFGDLAKQDGNYVEKTSIKGTYTIGDWGVQITSLTKGDFYHSQETKSDGTRYVLPEMTTMNVSVYYKFDIAGNKARIKFAVKNIEDERAPLADRFYGFFADAHQDMGRNSYIDFKVSF